MSETPQSMIDHAAYERSVRQDILKRSLRSRLEAVANYHTEIAATAAQLRYVLEQTRFYPDMLTPDTIQFIQYCERQILEHYINTFGVEPSWPRHPGQYSDL